MNMIYDRTREFIYRNARPLDLARWRYHFEGGSREAVLTALSFYQNGDGGFGHGLEADAWNPNSSPIQTWVATELLREIDFSDASHPIVQGILRYLASGRDFDGVCWYKAVKSNNGYPHAPWWYTEEDTSDGRDYNPSACLAGFLIRFAAPGSAAHELGCRIAREACAQLFAAERENGMHTLTCYVRLAEYLERAGNCGIVDLPALKALLLRQVHSCITRETDEWETSYVCRPSQFFQSPDSVFYAANKSIADFECGFLARTQLADGSWPINWRWDAYPDEWGVSQNWWKSDRIILNLLYLRGFGQLS